MKRMSSGRLEKASDTLRQNHRRFMESRSFRLFLVKKEWPSLVGDMLARESYPADFLGETLIVQVTNSAWMQQLMMLRSRILQRLSESEAGRAFTDIRFRVGRGRREPSAVSTVDGVNREIKKQKAIRSLSLSPEERKWIENWVNENVEQKELRNSFFRLMESAMRQRKGELAAGYHICPACGGTCPPEQTLCDSCERKASALRRNEVIRLLKSYPHYGYQMVNQVIPVSYEEYAEAHDFLRIKCEEQIYHRVHTEENKRMLLSLLLHKPMDDITIEEAEEKLPHLKVKRLYK